MEDERIIRISYHTAVCRSLGRRLNGGFQGTTLYSSLMPRREMGTSRWI